MGTWVEEVRPLCLEKRSCVVKLVEMVLPGSMEKSMKDSVVFEEESVAEERELLYG